VSALRDLQVQYLKLLPRLVDQAFTMGFELTLGEGWRTDEQAIIHAMGAAGRAELAAHLEKDPRFHGLAVAVANNGNERGIVLSLHRDRLAIDLNLFKDGRPCVAEEYRPVGEWWEKQHSLARWGGRFGDADHFSFEFQGRK
jgi:hypothetical protein